MTTATQRFIEDAEKGGYIVPKCDWANLEHGLIDPKMWQAVGKVREWTEKTYWTREDEIKITLLDTWQNQWHTFIDALADGKSIEQSLLAIE